MSEGKCVTHHNACDCREAMFADLRQRLDLAESEKKALFATCDNYAEMIEQLTQSLEAAEADKDAYLKMIAKYIERVTAAEALIEQREVLALLREIRDLLKEWEKEWRKGTGLPESGERHS